MSEEIYDVAWQSILGLGWLYAKLFVDIIKLSVSSLRFVLATIFVFAVSSEAGIVGMYIMIDGTILLSLLLSYLLHPRYLRYVKQSSTRRTQNSPLSIVLRFIDWVTTLLFVISLIYSLYLACSNF